ncbi:MAG: hypothetical protein ACREP4_02820 [Stenotrophomonas sp.]|uniref:hypothetical protein n=1 Tax=Stenotrophomonas sp. TaxID=69392 RepID=UPI003D6D2BAA
MSRTAWGSRVLWATGIVTAAAIAAGVWVIDSPSQQRLKRLDAARVSDLQTLEIAARNYWRENDTLPPNILALAAQPGMVLTYKDPSGGPDYRYRTLDATHYELCAQFDTSSAEGPQRGRIGEWTHPAGHHCFRRAVGEKDSE